MMNKGGQRSTWSQPSPRAEMAAEAKSLDSGSRTMRFAIRHGKPGHIEDEVIVTLFLDAWDAGHERESDTYASELLRRVTQQVRAHVRKNPGWQQLGGGSDTAIEDFCQEIVLSILRDRTVPNHAEVAFGNYVYRRCLDEAGKLYAKKHSAGKSLDNEDVDIEAIAQTSDSVDPLSAPKSPDQVLIEIEEFFINQELLEKIRRIVQNDLPELPQIAFTYRYFGNLKIESKKKEEVTVTSIMGVTEKTATKYINQAIKIIQQRLSND